MTTLQPYSAHENDMAVDAWEGIVSWRTLLSADQTPSAGITMGVATIAPSSSVVGARHHHAQHEAYYFLHGHGEAIVGDATFPVHAGSVVFVPGDTPHFVRNTGDIDLRLLYVFATDQFSDVVYCYDNEV